MTDQTPGIPPAAQAKDRKDLGFAAIIAVGIAIVLLVLVVLPAEHGIDPTGFGRVTGIDGLSGKGGTGERDGLGAAGRSEPAPPRNDTVVIELAGLADDEYKFHLLADQTLLYAWTADGPVDFD